MYNCTYYYANDCTPETLDNACTLCIIIYSVKEDIIIFSLRFLVLVFLHKDYVTENVTANI